MGTDDVSLGCDVPGEDDNTNIVDTSGFIPNPGSWYNPIGIYHRGTLQFYINGKLVSTRSGQGTKANLCPASRIVIGDWWNPSSNSLNMNGKLDNIRLYNRVLTPNEIIQLSKNYQVTSTGQRSSPHFN